MRRGADTPVGLRSLGLRPLCLSARSQRCVAIHLTFLRAVWPRAQFTYTSLFGAYSSYLFLRTGLIVAPLAACAGGQESPPPPTP